MKRMTVRNRILISNALMVIVTLFLFFIINLGVIKVYSETIETEFKATAQQMIEEDALTEGASRIKDNRLTENITYTGDIEFEQICEAINEMQEHLQSEQDKNRRYEKARTDSIPPDRYMRRMRKALPCIWNYR